MSAEVPLVTPPDPWTTRTQTMRIAADLTVEVERAVQSVKDARSYLATAEERLVSLRARLGDAAEREGAANAAWLEDERVRAEARAERYATLSKGSAS